MKLKKMLYLILGCICLGLGRTSNQQHGKGNVLPDA